MIPTRLKVVEHFKNARIVRCLCYGEAVNISKEVKRKIYKHNNKYWIDIENHFGECVKLWDEEKGYADIIKKRCGVKTTKTRFTITKDFIMQLYKNSNLKTKLLLEKRYSKLFKL